jgi:hypothetical protein
MEPPKTKQPQIDQPDHPVKQPQIDQPDHPVKRLASDEPVHPASRPWEDDSDLYDAIEQLEDYGKEKLQDLPQKIDNAHDAWDGVQQQLEDADLGLEWEFVSHKLRELEDKVAELAENPQEYSALMGWCREESEKLKKRAMGATLAARSILHIDTLVSAYETVCNDFHKIAIGDWHGPCVGWKGVNQFTSGVMIPVGALAFLPNYTNFLKVKEEFRSFKADGWDLLTAGLGAAAPFCTTLAGVLGTIGCAVSSYQWQFVAKSSALLGNLLGGGSNLLQVRDGACKGDDQLVMQSLAGFLQQTALGAVTAYGWLGGEHARDDLSLGTTLLLIPLLVNGAFVVKRMCRK